MIVANNSLTKIRRGIRQLWYRDIWHFWPSAPLNWRYFLPTQSAAIRMHRQLWWHSRYKLPGLLWLPMELVRWIYWRLWVAHRLVSKAVASNGPEVAERFGISTDMQRQQLAFWAKAWCIDPYTAYNWQLFRPDANGLAIIYENQTSAFHALQNRKTGATKADHRLLGDKIKLAEKLSALGVPMVTTAIISSGDWQDVLSALHLQARVFCKLRSGNQGESAFAVWQGEQGLSGQALTGKQLPDEAVLKQAWQTLSAKGAVLIQPLLENHAALSSASEDGSAITLRVVTRIGSGGINVWFAELHIPGKFEEGNSRGFWRIAVSILKGELFSLPKHSFLKKAWQDENDGCLQQLATLERLPFWSEICRHSISAHHELPKVWAIAWDWVITPNGPVLLEGNGGWGLDTPQMQLGGFANPP